MNQVLLCAGDTADAARRQRPLAGLHDASRDAAHACKCRNALARGSRPGSIRHPAEARRGATSGCAHPSCAQRRDR